MREGLEKAKNQHRLTRKVIKAEIAVLDELVRRDEIGLNEFFRRMYKLEVKHYRNEARLKEEKNGVQLQDK